MSPLGCVSVAFVVASPDFAAAAAKMIVQYTIKHAGKQTSKHGRHNAFDFSGCLNFLTDLFALLDELVERLVKIGKLFVLFFSWDFLVWKSCRAAHRNDDTRPVFLLRSFPNCFCPINREELVSKCSLEKSPILSIGLDCHVNFPQSLKRKYVVCSQMLIYAISVAGMHSVP